MFYYDYEHQNTDVYLTDDKIKQGSGFERKKPGSSKLLTDNDLSQIKSYIKDNISKHLTVGELALSVDISKFHFVRVFKKLTGTTPYQFIIEQRIIHTKNLLEQNEINISAIAYQSGFANQSHFTTVFKRITGMTPKEYRDRHVL